MFTAATHVVLTESVNQPKQQYLLQNGEHTAIGIGENEVRKHDTIRWRHSKLSFYTLANIVMIWIDRGIGNFCYRTVQTRGTDTQFVCGSGMNTVLAVSYCARQLGVEALIVVPKATKERICETIRGDGSQLILYGEVKINIYCQT